MPRRSRSRSPPPRQSSSFHRRSPPPSDRPAWGKPKEYTSSDRERERERDRARYDDRSAQEGGRGDRNGGAGWVGRDEGYVRRRDEGRGGRDDRRRSRSRSSNGRGGGGPVLEDRPEPKPVEPDFSVSGALAAETNMTASGAVLKYNEPPEARKPTLNWRLYVFKGKEQVELFQIHRQSAYLVGRDSAIVDIPIPHPSCSKQHAVIQFRLIKSRNEFGDETSGVKPFVIDLEATNGTFVNDAEIPASRYYELKASDVLKFGQSSREYVLLHEETS